jgi:isoleucyl-tRNA synthetase
MARYRPVQTKVDLPALELEVLEFWRRERIFQKTLELRRGAPEWVFYEGPPTANGVPGIHHVEARTFKDLYPRYKTMTGHYVHRKAGWDCHGIPVELEVEKKIGTKNKRDIEAFGIARFNDLCRQSVQEYVDEWARLTERIAFWVDLDDAYWTMDPQYIESVWWALKRLHQGGLLFRDDKVTAYCPRCGTPLSDHEVALGYTQVTDPSIFVKFPVVEGPPEAAGAAIVAWTTTPWTLISNQGLVVSSGHPYVRVRTADGEELIVAEARRFTLPDGETVATFPGSAVVGARYEPPYPNVKSEAAHRVVASGGVSMDEGTGVVHMAAAFGAEDLEIGRREGWPVYKPVDDEAKFTAPAPELVQGKFVKDADPPIVEDLRERGLLVASGTYEHTYPLCWRCDTPLIYLARPAWYIRTTAVKKQLLDANDHVNWYPEHIKHGRYGDWLENNVDWSLSRERYWGTPLPIWVCPQGHETGVGSLAELSTLAGRDLGDLDPHRPHIDEVTFGCSECRGVATRVPYLIDVWFDAGAMPYAQWGYPHAGPEAEETFARRFPADFIAEAIDQTRGWFYTLMAEGVLLFEQSPYRNVVCLGHLVDRDGRKMSKRLGNIIDPWLVIDRYGADALRWLMIAGGSPWSQRRIYPEAFQDVVRQFLLTLWNVHAFYVTYANLDDPDLAAAPTPSDRSPLDRWMLSRLHATIEHTRDALERYDATGAGREIVKLVDDLSNWYVRRSRRRFWDPSRSGGDTEASPQKLAAYATLHECLVTVSKLLAPFIPFVAEEMYRNVGLRDAPDGPESVHLADYPVADPGLVDLPLEEAMAIVRQVVSLGRTVRTEAKVRVRQPLGSGVLHVPGDPGKIGPLLGLVAEELNVRHVAFAESAEELSGWRAKPNFRVLGPRLGRGAQEVAGVLAGDDGSLAARLAAGETVTVAVPSGEVRLAPEDVDLIQEPRTGWAVATDGGVTVALDLDLDDELRREGLVRELIHHVQNLRKSAGLEVADRIVLGLEVADGIGLGPEARAATPALRALHEYRGYVAAEVLAVEIVDEPVPEPAGTAEADLDGTRVRLTLRRA